MVYNSHLPRNVEYLRVIFPILGDSVDNQLFESTMDFEKSPPWASSIAFDWKLVDTEIPVSSREDNTSRYTIPETSSNNTYM